MGKKTLQFIITLGLLGSLLSGCSAGDDSSNEIAELKKEIAALKEENQQLKEGQEAVKTDSEPEESAAASEQPETTSAVDAPLIAELNKAVTVADFAEFTVVKTQFNKVIKPSKPGDFHTYYEAKDEGNTYLAITIKLKSLLAAGKSADDFASLTIKYNDKYEYRTFSTIEEQGGADFTYTSITSIEPLKTETLVFLAEVPKEVETDTGPLKAIITINEAEYDLIIR